LDKSRKRKEIKEKPEVVVKQIQKCI